MLVLLQLLDEGSELIAAAMEVAELQLHRGSYLLCRKTGAQVTGVAEL